MQIIILLIMNGTTRFHRLHPLGDRRIDNPLMELKKKEGVGIRERVELIHRPEEGSDFGRRRLGMRP